MLTTKKNRFYWALAGVCLLLSGCLSKDYVPPKPAPRPDYRSAQEVSAQPFAADIKQAERAAPNVPDAGQLATPQAGDGSIKVALLLPLTGRNAELGRALEHAATLSLFDQYASLSPKRLGIKVTLLPVDTGDTDETAKSATEKAIEAGAQLLIGPVFGDTVRAVAPLAQAKKIPLISLSNNKAVAAPGAYVFGFAPEQQAARMIQYAIKGGKQRIGALIPDTPYGRAVLASANQVLRANELAFAAVARYSPQGVGIDAAVEELLPSGGEPVFDVLFLPESGQALIPLLRSVQTRTTSNLTLIGTGLWDDYNLIRKVNLQGALFASSPATLTQAFEKRFANTYHYTPPRIASLAYDAVALAVTLATSGRGFANEVLTHRAGFSGPANGLFRFQKDGTSERKLAVMLVQGAGFIVVDAASINFAEQ